MERKRLEELRVERAKRMLDAKILFDYFRQKWEKRYHENFGTYQPAIRKKIRYALWFVDLEELQLRVRRFFQSTDSWVVENRHPIFYFLKYHARFKCKDLHNGILNGNRNGQKTYHIANHANFDVEREIKKYRYRKTLGR